MEVMDPSSKRTVAAFQGCTTFCHLWCPSKGTWVFCDGPGICSHDSAVAWLSKDDKEILVHCTACADFVSKCFKYDPGGPSSHLPSHR